MFEEQIKNEYQRLFELLLSEDGYNFEYIINSLNDELFYKTFIQAEAYYNCFKMLTIMSTEPIFQDNLYQDINAEDDFYNFQSKFSCIEESYLKTLLQQSVELRFNFVIRPITTITSYIFSESLTISVSEAILKSKYFNGDSFIIHFVMNILKNTQTEIITRAEFLKFLNVEIKNYIINLNSTELTNLTNSLFELMDEVETQNFIVLALIVFFDDLKMFGIVDNLDSIKDNFLTFSKNDLNNLIERVLTLNNSDDNISESIEDLPKLINQEELDIHTADFWDEAPLMIDEPEIEFVQQIDIDYDNSDFITSRVNLNEDNGLNLDENILSLKSKINECSEIKTDDYQTDSNEFELSELKAKLDTIFNEIQPVSNK